MTTEEYVEDALAKPAESAVPLPPLPVARAAGSRRLSRALWFGLFMALGAALWAIFPSLVSWLLTRQFHDQQLNQLVIGSPPQSSKVLLGLRTALFMLLFGVAGFVCSFRASTSARPVAALDNGAC